jgi:hypothetical protein
MSVQQGFVVFMVVMLAISTWLGLVFSTGRRNRMLRSHCARHGVVLGPEAQVPAERLLVAHRRGLHVGSLLGSVVMFLLVFKSPLRTDEEGAGSFAYGLAILPVLWLQSIGGTIAVGLAGRPRPDERRIARAPQPAFDDYVQGWRRWWGPVALAVAATLGLARLVSSPQTELVTGYGVVVGLALAALSVAVGEALGLWLLRAPQPAPSLGVLQLSDTIKGEMLSGLSGGFVPIMVAATLLIERVPLLITVSFYALIVGVVAVVAMERSRRVHLRTRLWPMAS